MEKHWKYCKSVKVFSSSKSRNSVSPARKVKYSPFKRALLITSSKGKRGITLKTSTPTPTTQESSPLPSTSTRFMPKTRLYLELSESPTPYDLKSKNLVKDLESAKRLINYEDLEKKRQKVRKEYKQLTKKDIKRVGDEREDLLDLGMSFNKSHQMAKEFFDQVKKGNEAKIASIVKEFPEIVREVDGTGQTALHWAARRRFPNIVKGLLMCGANPMTKDMVGRRPEDIARAKKFLDVSELLVAARRRTANVSKIFVSNDQRTNNPMVMLMNMKVRRTVNPLNNTVL